MTTYDLILLYIAGYLTALLLMKIEGRISGEPVTLPFAITMALVSWATAFTAISFITKEYLQRIYLPSLKGWENL